MAAGIPIAGADVGVAYWNAIGTGETIPALTLTLHPYSKESGPATPTKVAEILPWAKANLGIDVPFEGDDTTLLRPLGIGVSEAITVGTIQSIPIRAGIGWLGGTGTCWFVRTTLIEF
jgi:hypothetical protein